MTDPDDELQAALARLENGVPVGDVLADVGDEPELTQLLQLAAQVRDMTHLEAAPPTGRPPRLLPAVVTRHGAADRPRRWTMSRSSWLASGIVGAAAVALVVFFGVVLWLNNSLFAGPDMSAAMVGAVHGRVEIGSTDGRDWHAASPGELVRSGQHVRTGTGASATVTFFEGTVTRIDSESEVVLTRVAGRGSRELQVELSQVAGTTTHQVVPLQGDAAEFLVHAPGGTARVHGTTFTVAVAASGATRYAVEHGSIWVDNGQHEVVLETGQATVAEVGQDPAPPAYQFVGAGEITSLQGTAWVVAGVPMVVGSSALDSVSEIPAVGQFIHVTGRILDDGTWVADSVALVEAGDGTFSFSGPIQATTGEQWRIAGVTVAVNNGTVLADSLKVNDLVNVTFRVVGGEWVAQRIVAIDASGHEPTATPTATADPAAQPVLVFQPGELLQSACASSYVFDADLRNTASQVDDVAAIVELTYTIVQGAQFVEMVSVKPDTWQSIAAGQSVSVTTTLTTNAAWSAAPAGSEIQLRLSIAAETNRPGGHDTKLSLIAESTCATTPAAATQTSTSTLTATTTPSTTGTPVGTLTPTATLTPTMSVTPSVTAAPTLTPTPGATAGACTGADPQPHGMTLAQKYGVSYEEIMGWFCQGYGFGEIEHAYDLSRETGVAVPDIFSLRASGLGWGQIRKQLTAGPGGGKPTKAP